jgi:hypothetical protein
MKFILDDHVSFEILYNPESKLYTRKIRKNGVVIDVKYVDESAAESYFGIGELRMFRKYLGMEDKDATEKG